MNVTAVEWSRLLVASCLIIEVCIYMQNMHLHIYAEQCDHCDIQPFKMINAAKLFSSLFPYRDFDDTSRQIYESFDFTVNYSKFLPIVEDEIVEFISFNTVIPYLTVHTLH